MYCVSTILMLVLALRGVYSAGGSLKVMMDLGMNVFGVKDTIHTLEKVVEDGHKEFQNAQQTFTSKYHSLIDQIDDHALEELFAQLFPQVPRDTGNNSCVEGVKGTVKDVGSVIMEEGKLLYFKELELKPKIKKEVGDFELSEVQLIFPKIELDYKFRYISKSMTSWDRHGNLRLSQSGQNVVAVVVTLPKARSTIDLLIKRKKCFIKVQSIDYRLGLFKIENVHYESLLKGTVGVGYTENYIREIVSASRLDIEDTLKKTLKDLVTPATNNAEVFCESDVTHPEPIDCKKINDASKKQD